MLNRVDPAKYSGDSVIVQLHKKMDRLAGLCFPLIFGDGQIFYENESGDCIAITGGRYGFYFSLNGKRAFIIKDERIDVEHSDLEAAKSILALL